MTKRKKIKNLINLIDKNKPKEKDLKAFYSEFIELMAETGIHPSVRQEFFYYTQKPRPDKDKILGFARKNLNLILEKI
jgi:hypothetical protein